MDRGKCVSLRYAPSCQIFNLQFIQGALLQSWVNSGKVPEDVRVHIISHGVLELQGKMHILLHDAIHIYCCNTQGDDWGYDNFDLRPRVSAH